MSKIQVTLEFASVGQVRTLLVLHNLLSQQPEVCELDDLPYAIEQLSEALYDLCRADVEFHSGISELDMKILDSLANIFFGDKWGTGERDEEREAGEAGEANAAL
jgi:hypothetical protein